MKPMLAESIRDDRERDRLLVDDDWCVEQKLDGQRILLHVDGGRVDYLNRKGESTHKPVPPAVGRTFGQLPGEWYFDGELVTPEGGNAMDGVFWLFDLPQALDTITTATPLDTRKETLDQLYERMLDGEPAVRLLPTTYDASDKRDLFEKVLANGGEGIMFKHLDSAYLEGKRSRHIKKAKNRYEADCVVTRIKIGGKDNMELAVFDGGKLKVIGECTALAGDGGIIKAGDVVCVTYLYVGAGGRLYQPTKPMLRDDKDAAECSIDQLVHVNKAVLA